MKRFACMFRTGVVTFVVLGVLSTLLVGLGMRTAPTAHAAPPPHAGPPPRGASITILPNAHLATVNGVAGITVRLKYSCPPSPNPEIGTMGALSANAFQVRSDGRASGFFAGSAVCDGKLHVTPVFVPNSRFATAAFAPGEAIVGAQVNNNSFGEGFAIADVFDVPIRIPGRPTS